jgi:hypothetical protein
MKGKVTIAGVDFTAHCQPDGSYRLSEIEVVEAVGSPLQHFTAFRAAYLELDRSTDPPHLASLELAKRFWAFQAGAGNLKALRLLFWILHRERTGFDMPLIELDDLMRALCTAGRK